jgi:hypothetical protein
MGVIHRHRHRHTHAHGQQRDLISLPYFFQNKASVLEMGLNDTLHEIEQQLRWYGHVMRKDCKIARQVAEWKPEGKRRHGRPVQYMEGWD